MRDPNTPSRPQPQAHNGFTRPAAWLLHHGRSRQVLVRIVPDNDSLYRVEWPDTTPSQVANLTRCKQAALEWAESKMLADLRKKHGVGALKSLDNFSWSASPMRLNGDDHVRPTSAPAKTNGGVQ
jgi:hypothetical protein